MSLGKDIHPYWGGGSPEDSAVLNWSSLPSGEFSIYALGYHRAGRALVDRIRLGGRFPDYDAYPIFFLYRHSLELYLKALIVRGAVYLKLMSPTASDWRKVCSRHELVRLLPAVQAVLRSAGWKDGFGLPELESWQDFHRLVVAVEAVDERSYAFRYPVDTSGVPVLPKHLVLGPIAFGTSMDPVLDLLDSACDMLESRIDLACEVNECLRQLVEEWRRDD